MAEGRGASNIIRAEGANHSSVVVSWSSQRRGALSTINEIGASLRPRQCRGPGCGALFWVCSHCDRGQRYCSQPCREVSRRQQRRAANRRYQQTEAGKHAHRHRQRAYRQREATASVTDHGSWPITAPRTVSSTVPAKCVVCGLHSRWINPFRVVPRRREDRWARSWSAHVQKTTFSGDR